MLKSQSAAGRTCPQGARETCALPYKSSVRPREITNYLQSKRSVDKTGIQEAKSRLDGALSNPV